ncbi:MAG: hypothetical protein JRI95_13600 [Deltaproteobacteria bacterium]|nr:hypothetical protein [Deltaproteobacteria bacterium]
MIGPSSSKRHYLRLKKSAAASPMARACDSTSDLFSISPDWSTPRART